jgi:hypothetical protein
MLGRAGLSRAASLYANQRRAVIGSACRILRPSFPFILTSPDFLFHFGCSYAGTHGFSQADCINEAVEAIPLRPELADVLRLSQRV